MTAHPNPRPRHGLEFAIAAVRAAIEKAAISFTNGGQHANGKVEIELRLWLSDPRVLDGVVRPSTSIGSEDVRPRLPTWLRSELRKQLQEKITSDGEPITQEQAENFIDKALASGALDSAGTLTFRVKGTRAQIVEQILEVCELWNEPMTNAKAEAKADAAIRVMWGRRIFAWFSSAMWVLAMILVFLLVIGIIAAEADPAPVFTTRRPRTSNISKLNLSAAPGKKSTWPHLS